MTPEIKYCPEQELIFISQELDEDFDAAMVYDIHEYDTDEALAEFLLMVNDIKAEHELN